MKKHLLSLLALIIYFQFAHAQAPHQFNYQGAARNADGSPISNRAISLRLSILDGKDNGPAVYIESRKITTSAFGLYNIQIGSAGSNSTIGSIGGVAWGQGDKYLKVEIDPYGGSNYGNAGTAQLLSVPYALYAANAPAGEKGERGETGAVGANGKSAYELWLLQGNTGTVADYLNSLKGKDGITLPSLPGEKGMTGQSAYEVWIQAGNTGSITDYLNSLRGNQGERGERGEQGIAGLSNGPAGGDLSGSYPAPQVVGLQGIAVSVIKPVNNQVLQYNGSNWTSATLNEEAIQSAKGIQSTDLSIQAAQGATLKDVVLNIRDAAITLNKLAANSVNTEKIVAGGNDKILGTDGAGKVVWQDKPAAISPGSWYDVNSKAPASVNTQNIYQLGNVGVMTTAPLTTLDVRGSARFGVPVSAAVVGDNSGAFGNTNESSGTNTMAFGQLNKASGTNAAVFGKGNEASGGNATAFGMENKASGTQSTVFGTANTAAGSRSTVFGTLSNVTGHYSTSFGSTNRVPAYMSTVIGANLISSSDFQFVTGTNNAHTSGENILVQVGNGDPNRPDQRFNAMTIMKNGSTAIGTHAGFPNSTVQVFGSFSAKIRALGGGTVADDDFTVLVKGNISLPVPSASNTGRMYHLIGDSLMDTQLSGSFRVFGIQVSVIILDGKPGSRGYMVQSDGTDWVVIGQY